MAQQMKHVKKHRIRFPWSRNRRGEGDMNETRFTERAQAALRLAQEGSAELGHGYVGSEHLLLGLASQEYSTAARLLREEGVAALKDAKANHDKLEAVYNPYVDFDGVRTLAALEAGRLLSWLG